MERARIYLVRATYIRGIARPAGAEDMQQLMFNQAINAIENGMSVREAERFFKVMMYRIFISITYHSN